MFDLLNVTLRKIKTKTKKAKYQKHTISLEYSLSLPSSILHTETPSLV